MKQFTLIIALILFSFLSFVSGVAQTTETKKAQTAEEKQKEIEIRKFVIDFASQMDEKKDIRLITENYFTADFKQNFMSFIFSSDDFPTQFTQTERYQSSSEMFNLMYLGLMSMYGNGYNFDSFSDEKTDNIVKKILPPNIIELAKSNPYLKALIEDNDEKSEDLEKDLKDAAKVRQLVSDLHKINEALKTHIESQPLQWHKSYQIKVAEGRKECDYFNARVCDKENCGGLPEKTIIYHHDLFPFCLEIIEKDGSYKIMKIYLRMD